MSQFLNELKTRVLVLDGAMGTRIQQCDLNIDTDYLGQENCVDLITRTRPDLIAQIHESFLEVGADAVETNTFGANGLVLSEFDFAHETRHLNKEAAEIARAACDRYTTQDKPRFVIGSIGPGTKLITLGHTTWDEMYEAYYQQAIGLIEGGADVLLIETCQDILQIKCVINACHDAMFALHKTINHIPIWVSVTIETNGTMLLGTSIQAAMTALRMYPISGLGLNCATGPKEMGEHLSVLARSWDRYISVIPNAGLPALVDGQTVFPLQPDAFADAIERFVHEFGVKLVGGCCGTTHEHIREVAKRLQNSIPAPQVRDPWVPAISSLYSSVDLKQELSFLIIGERTNANGSRKFKRLLEEEDWDGLVAMGKEQIRDGSHATDVCVDMVGRDGVSDMSEVVSRYVKQVDSPLVIDSTNKRVIEEALKLAGGKCIVNSINLEDGEQRFDDICPLLRKYGAAAIALTIDEDKQQGMAKTASRKVEIAKRMYDLFTYKWGMDPVNLIFDPLTFTIATGVDEDRSLGYETLDAIQQIHEQMPSCGILLGLSNISFGLKPAARHVLNSVYLAEAVNRGLTAAIVHASKIKPRNKIPDAHWQAALDLIYNRWVEKRDPLHHYISLFPDGDTPDKDVESLESLSLEDQLRHHIIDGDHTNLTNHLDDAMLVYSPTEIINNHLLEGMKTVGMLFGSGQMQLPFVLQSAEVMKAAVAYLEPLMKTSEKQRKKAKIILATVQGDVHDIGKNLVDIILSNNGFDVVNIGIKQTIANILSAYEEHNADAIGLSGLLVKSVTAMEDNLRELNVRKMYPPVLLGGAALTRKHTETHLRNAYEGSVYYGKDAFDGLKIMTAIAEGTTKEIDNQIQERAHKYQDRAKTSKTSICNNKTTGNLYKNQSPVQIIPGDTSDRAVSNYRPVYIPTPPFFGIKLVDDVALDDVYPYINKTALYRAQWGFKKGSHSKQEYKDIVDQTVDPIFIRLSNELRERNILQPQVVYGYFPCTTDGNDLVLFDPDRPTQEIERFSFPRQELRKKLCITDFFSPPHPPSPSTPSQVPSCSDTQIMQENGSDALDVIGMFVCTVGQEITNYARQLFERDEYSEYLYVHGMGVETAEALAEYWHRKMRIELAIADHDAQDIRKLFQQKYRGSRYSFGYAACPELSDQKRIFKLLQPEKIGCHLTDNYQIDPEASVSAIIVHHPDAKYFNI